jgi:hypothetical protein
MRDDNFLGHPGGSSPGHWMVLLVYLVVAVEGLGEAEGYVEKPLMQIRLFLQALHWLVLQF